MSAAWNPHAWMMAHRGQRTQAPGETMFGRRVPVLVVMRVSPEEVVGEWYHLSEVADPESDERLATSWKVTDDDLRVRRVDGDLIST